MERIHGSKPIRFFPAGKRKLVLLIPRPVCLWHSLSSDSFLIVISLFLLLFFFPGVRVCVCVCVCVVCVCAQSCLCVQLCLILCHPVNCSPPGSSVQGISQARILEWVAISSSRGSSWPRDWSHSSCLAGGFSTTEPLGKPRVNVGLAVKKISWKGPGVSVKTELLLNSERTGYLFFCLYRVIIISWLVHNHLSK